jgi:PAS domain S-box-containing protein
MDKAAKKTKKPGDDASPAKNLITALLADNAWFRAMVDSSPMGISIARDGITVYANDACVKMFGYDSAEEFIGTSRLNRVAPDHRWQLNLYINKRKRGEAVPNQYEFMGLRKDGTTFPVFTEIAGVPFGDETLSVAFFTDFTERKRIESALQASEKRYRTLVETADDFITEVTPKGVILYASPRILSITGYKAAEVIGKTPFDFMEPKQSSRMKRLFEEKAKKGEPIRGFRNVVIRPDGSAVTLETNASPLFDPDGRLAGYCAASRDITHLKRTEEALRGSEQQYRNLIESIDEYIAEADASGRCTYASPKVFDFIGYGPHEVIGKRPFDFMAPSEAERVERIFREKAARCESFDYLEHTLIHKNGAAVIVETSGTPFFGEDGELRGYRTISRNITRRKLAMEALALAQSKYRDIFENAVEGIYRSVPEGRYVDVNPAFARIFGYDSPEELKTAVNDIGRQLYTDPEVRRECVRIVEERGHGSFEIAIRRRDGSTGWVFNNVRAVHDAQGRTLYYEGFVEDITDRKRMEEALREAYGELEERVRERTAELARVNEALSLDIEKRTQAEETLRLRENELEIRSRKLEDLNTTLRTLLEQRDQDRLLLEERVIANINKLIMPALETLKSTPVNRHATAMLGVLEANLKEIVSPFSQQLSAQSASLTQTEVQIANCIMQGMRSKEIAGLMKLSKGTVDFYRNNIRKKLGIRNQKANLQSYLLAHFKM